jgi:hypothetical protein
LLRWDHQRAPTANLHADQPLAPSGNHLVELERDRLSALPGRVEDGPGRGAGPRVGDGHLVALLHLVAGALNIVGHRQLGGQGIWNLDLGFASLLGGGLGLRVDCGAGIIDAHQVVTNTSVSSGSMPDPSGGWIAVSLLPDDQLSPTAHLHADQALGPPGITPSSENAGWS